VSWCACVALNSCTSCAAPIHAGEPIYWGDRVPNLRYCAACAKRRLNEDVPGELPTVRTSGDAQTADIKALAADLRERILEHRSGKPMRFDARQAQIARE
jgi:hypothetical protein